MPSHLVNCWFVSPRRIAFEAAEASGPVTSHFAHAAILAHADHHPEDCKGLFFCRSGRPGIVQ
jgi:hypothetical protein